MTDMPAATPISVEAEPELPFECPECGNRYKSKFLLGGHRRSVHQIAGSYSGKRGPSAGKQRAKARPMLVEVAREAAKDAGAGRPGVPSADQLTAAFARGLGTVTYAAASFAVEGDRALTTDELKEQMINYLSLSGPDAREACEPLGRAFAKTGLNRKYGRTIVDNVDVAGSVAVLITMGFHWRRYMSARAHYERQAGGGGGTAPVVQTPAPVAPPPQAAPMDVPEAVVPVTPNGAAQVEPMQGRVWTKDDVDAAFGRR
jgi:hypothetical protein